MQKLLQEEEREENLQQVQMKGAQKQALNLLSLSMLPWVGNGVLLMNVRSRAGIGASVEEQPGKGSVLCTICLPPACR
jgi:hypothetical protein